MREEKWLTITLVWWWIWGIDMYVLVDEEQQQLYKMMWNMVGGFGGFTKYDMSSLSAWIKKGYWTSTYSAV